MKSLQNITGLLVGIVAFLMGPIANAGPTCPSVLTVSSSFAEAHVSLEGIDLNLGYKTRTKIQDHLNDYHEGQISKKEVVRVLQLLKEDPKFKAYSPLEFASLIRYVLASDRLLLHSTQKFDFSVRLNRVGLKLSQRPQSFASILRSEGLGAFIHRTKLDRIINIFSAGGLRSQSQTGKNGFGLSIANGKRKNFVYLQAVLTKHLYRFELDSESEALFYFPLKVLDIFDWSHANLGWHFGAKFADSGSPDYSLQLFAHELVADRYGNGPTNEFMFTSDIHFSKIPFVLLVGPKTRKLLLQELQEKKVESPDARDWSEIIMSSFDPTFIF